MALCPSAPEIFSYSYGLTAVAHDETGKLQRYVLYYGNILQSRPFATEPFLGNQGRFQDGSRPYFFSPGNPNFELYAQLYCF